jgi:chitinase
LARYLSDVVSSEYKDHPYLLQFLASEGPTSTSPQKFNAEDAVPSTLSRKTALGLDINVKDELVRGIHANATAIAAAYYPDWNAGSFPPEKLDYSLFDILFFGTYTYFILLCFWGYSHSSPFIAFAVPNSSSGLTWDSGSQAILQRLVTSARNSGKGTKIVLSVGAFFIVSVPTCALSEVQLKGGWGGSYWFSSTCSSSGSRTTFVNTLKHAVTTFGLDGMHSNF